MKHVSHIIYVVILTVALLTSAPFYFLSEVIGLFAYAIYIGFKDGWYRGKRFW